MYGQNLDYTSEVITSKGVLRMSFDKWLIVLVMLLCSGCATLPNRFDAAAPQQNKAVVFDIDGTLTPTPMRIWQARDDAAETVQHFADQGYRIFYVTARVSFLQWQIPGWLEDNDFPAGALYVTQHDEDEDDHARFKTRILEQLIRDGWRIEWAFGDSTSDFVAYRAAGIPRERIFALQRACDDRCQRGEWNRCLVEWRDFMTSGGVPVVSPSP